MPSLAEALKQPDMEKITRVEPTDLKYFPSGGENVSGATYKTMFLVSPAPVVQTNSDLLKLFYRGGVPQTRLISPKTTASLI